MSVSVIIPAFNEEKYLGEKLKSVQQALELLPKVAGVLAEIIVVDNISTDLTVEVALSFGAHVVNETKHNIASVRNAGARFAKHDILVFIDADTLVPPGLLFSINQLMADSTCFGGAVDTDFRTAKPVLKIYFQLWRMAGKLTGMAQGATQFCRKGVFSSLSGYDESLFMGEDIDFYWRLKDFAKRQNGSVCFIEELKVIPSARRFEQWPLWRTLVCTHPLYIFPLRRREWAWRGWYKSIPR